MVLGALSGLLASPFDLVRIRPAEQTCVACDSVSLAQQTDFHDHPHSNLSEGCKQKLADVTAAASLQLDFALVILNEFAAPYLACVRRTMLHARTLSDSLFPCALVLLVVQFKPDNLAECAVQWIVLPRDSGRAPY